MNKFLALLKAYRIKRTKYGHLSIWNIFPEEEKKKINIEIIRWIYL